VRSPSDCRSTTARMLRPMRRMISWCDRPVVRDGLAAHALRELRGSMLYSAVTHPLPFEQMIGHALFDRRGAQHLVFPMSMSVEPSA